MRIAFCASLALARGGLRQATGAGQPLRRGIPQEAAAAADRGQAGRRDRAAGRQVDVQPLAQPQQVERHDPRCGSRQDRALVQGTGAGRRRPAHQCGRARHDREPRDRGHQGRRLEGERLQGPDDPQRTRRVDRRTGREERRLRLVPGAMRARADREVRGDRRFGRRHLRRAVDADRVARQPRRDERRRHRDREQHARRRLSQHRHEQHRRHPGVQPAGPAGEGRAQDARLLELHPRQQHGQLRAEGQHRRDRADRHRLHGARERRGGVLRQPRREQSHGERADPVVRQHRQAGERRGVRPVSAAALHPRQPLRGRRRQPGPARAEGDEGREVRPHRRPAGHPVGRRGRQGPRCRGHADLHSRQWRRRFRQHRLRRQAREVQHRHEAARLRAAQRCSR